MMLRYKDANECLMEGVSLEAMREALGCMVCLDCLSEERAMKGAKEERKES